MRWVLGDAAVRRLLCANCSAPAALFGVRVLPPGQRRRLVPAQRADAAAAQRLLHHRAVHLGLRAWKPEQVEQSEFRIAPNRARSKEAMRRS
jgi:hypothetical protein